MRNFKGVVQVKFSVVSRYCEDNLVNSALDPCIPTCFPLGLKEASHTILSGLMLQMFKMNKRLKALNEYENSKKNKKKLS